MLKRIRSEVFFFVASFLVALYFWIVRRTNFLIIDPPQEFHEPIDQNGTIIFALWRRPWRYLLTLPRTEQRIIVALEREITLADLKLRPCRGWTLMRLGDVLIRRNGLFILVAVLARPGNAELRLIRELGHLDFVGADLVEVSPPFDPSGITSMTAVAILFELLCVLAQARVRRRSNVTRPDV